MEPDEPNAEKLGNRHPRPTVIVGISNHKARQTEEKIDCQVCVAHQAQSRVEAKCVIEEMENDNEKCCASSQPVQHFKMSLSTACSISSDCIIGPTYG